MSVNEIFRAALHISSFLSIMKSDFLGCEMLSLTSIILGDLLLIESHLSDYGQKKYSMALYRVLMRVL